MQGLRARWLQWSILETNEEARDKVLREIAGMLNSATLKDYFCDGRLVPLSKVKGEDYVDPGEIRPIMVRSHLSKTAEKAITASIEASHKHHLSTGAYQSTSRRAVASTHINISEVITTSGSANTPDPNSSTCSSWT